MISVRELTEVALFHGIIERSRVSERIAAATEAPAVLIVAPAGCGKSVALAHYLEALPTPFFRYNIRAEHRTLAGFVRGLAEASESVAPGIRNAAADACSSALASDCPEMLLANWLERHLAAFSGTIAIDDIHLMDASSTTLLAALVERSELGIGWLFAGRHGHHLPVSTWLANGRCALPIEAEELRFTRSEAREAAMKLRSKLKDDEVDRLLRVTSGWAIGLALALRKSEHSDDLVDVTSSTRKLTRRYLIEHVYAPLSDNEREALVFGALLPEFDAEVMERAGFDGIRATLRSLEERIVFLSVAQSDCEGPASGTYFCHDLFREFLESELEALGESAMRAMRLQAANALYATGKVVAALRLFAGAGADREIVDLLRAHGAQLLEQAHGDSVKIAIDALPERTRGSDSVVLGLRAQQLIAVGQFKRAAALLRSAIAECDDVVQRTSLELQLGLASFSIGESPVPLLESAMAREAISMSMRGQLLALLAFAYAYFDDHAKVSPELVGEIESIAYAVDLDSDRAKILQRLGAATLVTGDSVTSTAALRYAGELALQQKMFKLAHSAYSALCINALVYEDDVSKAMEFASIDTDCAMKSGEIVRIRSSRLQRMDIAFRRGSADELAEILGVFESERHLEDPRVTTMIVGAQSMVAAWSGRFAEAHQMLGRICDDFWLLEERLLNKAFCAVLLAADGRREEASAMVEAVRRDGEVPDSSRPSFARYREIARALCALAEAVAGRLAVARTMLRKNPDPHTPVTAAMFGAVRAIARGMEAGLIAADGRVHFDALRELNYGGYACILERVVTHVVEGRRETVALTPAELAVLQAVAAGASPKAIALETGRSVLTVRTLLRRVIDKLGCSGREQAIRIARSRQLI